MMLLGLSDGRIAYVRIVWFLCLLSSAIFTFGSLINRVEGLRNVKDPVRLHYANRLIWIAVSTFLFFVFVGWWVVNLETSVPGQ